MNQSAIRAIPLLLVGGALVAAAEPDARSIAQRIDQVRRSEATSWKTIPWTASLVEARQVSARENCPVFLFTHDGNIETGRC